MTRVASLAPERSEGANNASRDTNILYVRSKTCDYHYYQCITPTETNLFHEERLFNMKSKGAKKERFREDQFVIWPRICSDNNCSPLHLHSRQKRVVKVLVVLLK